MTAAMRENRSTHCEMLVIGSRAGARGRPGSLGGGSSVVMSAISTNSRFKIRLTSFVGNAALGLNGPGAEMFVVGAGGGPNESPGATFDAAAASRSRPELPVTEGEKIGSLGSAAVTVVEVGPI